MAEETAAAGASQEPEIALAQRLAANEKLVRTKALKTLRKYISLRSQRETGGFTSEDLMKIWKGLFYCLWMQDQQLLQEELSDRISRLIHCFHTTDGQLLYFETFLQTVKREWNGIDRLRMDKFFQLVRFMFREAFEVLRRREWDSSLVNQLLEVFTAQLLQSTTRVPDGLMLHVLELYMTELALVGAAQLSAEQNLTFVDPFCRTMAKTKERSLLTSISKNIFSTIVDHASYALEDLLKELHHKGEDSDSGQASEEEEELVEEDKPKRRVFKKVNRKMVNGVLDSEGSDDELYLDDADPEEKLSDDYTGPVLQFDYGALADRLFELGSRANTHNLNRAKIYRLVKIFQDLSEGAFPHNDEMDTALRKMDSLSNKRNRKKRKEAMTVKDEYPAKKHKAYEDAQKMREPELDGAQSDTTAVNKKKKKKEMQKYENEKTAELDRKETDTQPPQTAVDPSPETRGAESQSESSDSKPGSQSHMEGSARKKNQKSKKLKAELQEVGEKVAAKHEDTSKEHTDIEIKECPDPDPLDELDSGAQPTTVTNLPSGRRKSGKNNRSSCTRLIFYVPHKDISASAPAKKKQMSVTADEETLAENPDNSSLSLVETSNAQWPEGAVSKKKQVDIDSATIEADVKKQRSNVNASTKKKKNKKQKLKEITAETAQVKEPEVANKEPTSEASEDKALKKEKKKAKQDSLLEKKEPKDEVEEKAAFIEPTLLKKKTEKNEKKKQLVAPVVENKVSQSAETSEEHMQKKRKQKQKANAKTACSSTTPVKKGKKRKMETSQINGHTAKEDPEISTSITPIQKLKMKKALSTSDFASFQGQTKTPSPLFCRVKPEGSSSSPLSSIKTFQSGKSETKKVRFGLKNNKTTEFRKTDRSLSVSPAGSSRVAFDPKKQPIFGVLKSPASCPSVNVKQNPAKRRPTAADFF